MAAERTKGHYNLGLSSDNPQCYASRTSSYRRKKHAATQSATAEETGDPNFVSKYFAEDLGVSVETNCLEQEETVATNCLEQEETTFPKQTRDESAQLLLDGIDAPATGIEELLSDEFSAGSDIESELPSEDEIESEPFGMLFRLILL